MFWCTSGMIIHFLLLSAVFSIAMKTKPKVHFKLVMDVYPNSTKVEQGTTVLLVCRVVGLPKTQTENFRCKINRPTLNGKNENPILNPFSNNICDLIAIDVLRTVRDQGQYTCSSNKTKFGTARFNLTVIGGIGFANTNMVKRPRIFNYFPRNSFTTSNESLYHTPKIPVHVACDSICPSTWLNKSSNQTISQDLTGKNGYKVIHPFEPDPKNKSHLRQEYICMLTDDRKTHITNTTSAVFGIFILPYGDIPPKVTNLRVQSKSAVSLIVMWTPPHSDDVIGYYINFQRLDFGIKITPQYVRIGMANSYKIIGLQPGVKYNITIWSTNGHAVSEAVNVIDTTEEQAPGVPRFFQLLKQNSSLLSFSWLPPANPNGQVHYQVDIFINVTSISCSNTIQRDLLKINLLKIKDPWLTYSVEKNQRYLLHIVKLYAVNSAGRTVVDNEIVSVCPADQQATVPDAPSNITGTSSSNESITLKWAVPLSNICDEPVSNYTVFFTREGKENGTSYRNQSVVFCNKTEIKGLKEGAIYIFNITAHNRLGRSNHSQPFKIKLEYQGPVVSDTKIDLQHEILTIVGSLVAGMCVIISICIFIIHCIRAIAKRRKATRKFEHLKESPSAHILLNVQPDIVAHVINDNQNEDTTEYVQLENPPYENIEHGMTDFVNMNGVPVKKFMAVMRRAYQRSLQVFKDEFFSMPKKHPYPTTTGSKSEQYFRNRYKDILPYDSSRVFLKRQRADENDYINASFIDGYGKSDLYIASQGPVHGSVEDFWQMIWDYKCPIIVMLTKMVEDHKRKCEDYFPMEMDEVQTMNRFAIITTSLNQLIDFEIRTLKVTELSTGEVLCLTHYFFTGWPDCGVPQSPTTLLRMLYHMREKKTEDSSIVIHCSAGVGRTGTFIALDYILDQINAEQTVDIKGVVEKMRQKRMLMVQTVEQYLFIYDAVFEMLLFSDTTIKSTDLRIVINRMKYLQRGEKMIGFEKQFSDLKTILSNTESDVKVNVEKGKLRYASKSPIRGKHLFVPIADKNEVQFINASFINGYQKRNSFIAAEAPMRTNTAEFWSLIWEHKIETIVLVCPLKENGFESCYKFWPKGEEYAEIYDRFKVNLDSKQRKYESDVYSLTIKCQSQEPVLRCTLYHFKSWQEKWNPRASSIIKMLQQTTRAKQETPVMVACNDGLGRSCTFIAIWSLIEQLKTEGQIDVLNTVKSIRTQRPGAIPELDQYLFIHELLLEYTESFTAAGYANFQ